MKPLALLNDALVQLALLAAKKGEVNNKSKQKNIHLIIPLFLTELAFSLMAIQAFTVYLKLLLTLAKCPAEKSATYQTVKVLTTPAMPV